MLSPTARKHRGDLAELARLAEADLSVLFQNVKKADHVRQGLMDMLPKLVAVYGSAAASLGADWYDELRQEAEVKGKFQAIVAYLPDVGRTDSLAGWAVGPLFGAKPDAMAALGMAAGGLQRIIFNADRETVMQSSIQDRYARGGWSREGSGECGFCSMLIGRGTVYSKGSADFASHDRCKCVAVPAFGGEAVKVKDFKQKDRFIPDDPNLSNRERVKIARRNKSVANTLKNDQARAREFIRAN
jgi:hypothetical protein